MTTVLHPGDNKRKNEGSRTREPQAIDQRKVSRGV